MRIMLSLYTLILCMVIVCCTNKPKQTETPQAPPNNAIGINDTLGLSLHPEYPVYSTEQKQVTFVLHNNNDSDINICTGTYSYTYEDKEGVWRDVPIMPPLIVFEEELILFRGNNLYINAELFRHIPGHYRFFFTVSKDSKEYTFMTDFQLTDNIPQLLEHPCRLFLQQADTLLPTLEEITGPFKLYEVVDKMPEFPGGIEAMWKFINANLQYPVEVQKRGIQGKVIIQFIIDENGSTTQPDVIRSVDPLLDKEAIRIVKLMPKWKPGMLEGKPVEVKYTIPITFKLNKLIP